MPPHHPIEKKLVSEMGSSVQNTRLWTQLKKPTNMKHNIQAQKLISVLQTTQP